MIVIPITDHANLTIQRKGKLIHIIAKQFDIETLIEISEDKAIQLTNAIYLTMKERADGDTA